MAKILCIEDEPLIREAIVEELSDAGHKVIECGNGREGLAAVLKHQPDLIVCDWLMPHMTGGELFTKLRNEYPQYRELPFVFVSAHAEQEHVAFGLGLGANAYLTKPLDLDELRKTVEALLGPDSEPRPA